jgi:vacuolar protein sorting-associated protein 13A/C
MTLFQPGKDNIDFVSSPESDVTDDKDLLNVRYTRVQKESPDFMTTFEGFEQAVDVRLSTFIFKASPEPLIAVYDFIMSAFVSRNSQPDSTPANSAILSGNSQPSDREAKEPTTVSESSIERMRVKVQLASVRCECRES